MWIIGLIRIECLFSPSAWITEQLWRCRQLVSGMEVNFPENRRPSRENIREIGLQFSSLSPFVENINRMVQAKITNSALEDGLSFLAQSVING